MSKTPVTNSINFSWHQHATKSYESDLSFVAILPTSIAWNFQAEPPFFKGHFSHVKSTKVRIEMLSCHSYISRLKPCEFWRIQVRHGVARMDGRKSQLDHIHRSSKRAKLLLLCWRHDKKSSRRAAETQRFVASIFSASLRLCVRLKKFASAASPSPGTEKRKGHEPKNANAPAKID